MIDLKLCIPNGRWDSSDARKDFLRACNLWEDNFHTYLRPVRECGQVEDVSSVLSEIAGLSTDGIGPIHEGKGGDGFIHSSHI